MPMCMATIHSFAVLHSISSYKFTALEPCGECQETSTSAKQEVLEIPTRIARVQRDLQI